MGFMDSLKSAASSFVKSVRHKTFKIPAEELAEKWEKLRPYGVEIEMETGYGGGYNRTAWYRIEEVSVRSVEVGIFHKSLKKKVRVKGYREVEREYEDEEDSGWLDFSSENLETIERREVTFWGDEKVKVRLTEADYERLTAREGPILG